MKLVRLLKDSPQHGVFAGEQIGLPDDDADVLVKRGKAVFADTAAPPAAIEAETPPTEDKVEPQKADDDDADEDQPVKRGPGRPRKNAD